MAGPVVPVVQASSVVRVTRSPQSPGEVSSPTGAEGSHAPVQRSQPGAPAATVRLERPRGMAEQYARFILDDQARLVQVQIVEAGTDRVVREIPPQALVEMAAALRASQDQRGGASAGG